MLSFFLGAVLLLCWLFGIGQTLAAPRSMRKLLFLAFDLPVAGIFLLLWAIFTLLLSLI